jgi:hypothetical protein
MRHIFGAVLASLTFLGISACGEASPPPAEGKASVQSQSGTNATIGAARSGDYLGTVLDGTNGTRVSCTVKRAGASFKVNGHIENAAMSLDITSASIADGATMSFFIQGTTEAVTSVDQDNNPGPSCSVTTTGSNYVVKSGSIYAAYDCPTVQSPTNISTSSHMSGVFLFTGCDK